MPTPDHNIQQEETKPEERRETAHKDAPAVTMTLTIQSSATVTVGLAMLIVGLLFGLYIRPLTLAQPASAASATLVTPPAGLPTTSPSIVTPLAAAPTTTPPAATPQAGIDQNLMASLVSKTRHFKGDANAPVTIIEFGDFQCPYCGRFAANTWPQINEQYVQSGKVRFGFWNMAFLGPESTWAAEAAECASDQNKYWEYHDLLFGSQSGENQGAFNKDNLKKFAEELSLDTGAFNDCLDSGKYTALIQEDTNAASDYGARSAPSFLVNGQSVVGAKPFDAFQQVIEPLLK